MNRTEPQREESGCQRRMVYALFVMVALLFVIQAFTLALVLTTYRPPTQKMQGNVGHVPSQEITMEIGRSIEAKAILPWTTRRANDSELPLSVQREHLVVNQPWDGRYFLYVQVTLQSSNPSEGPHMVRVKQGDRTLLEGHFTRGGASEALTTGFLGRQVELYSGRRITVSCSPPSYINTTDSVTYLGVFLLQLST